MKTVEFMLFDSLNRNCTGLLNSLAERNLVSISFRKNDCFNATGNIMALVAFANEAGFKQIRLICKHVY